jgi:hypothetical protein
MSTVLQRLRQSRPQSLPAPDIEAACVVAIFAMGLALLAMLPYDDILRSLLCFKFYGGYGYAY